MKGALRLASYRTAIVIGICATVIGGMGIRYARNNPQSILSYGLYSFGFDSFDPTYLERWKGEEMGFSLKSFSSRAELDLTSTGFGGCKESGVNTQAKARQYVFHEVHCDTALHLEMRGRVELSYFNDRLAAVRFFSVGSEEEYIEAFREKYRIRLKVGKRIRFSSSINVILRRIEDGFSLEWVDDRLEKQNRSWIMKHA